jgi:hypothetical protein
MKRSQTIAETAQFLLFAEAAIDRAFGETAALAGRLAKMHVEMGPSATVGQPVLKAVTAALAELAQARVEIIHAHRELADVKEACELANDA